MTQPTDDLAAQMVREMRRYAILSEEYQAAIARRYMEKAVAAEREDCAKIAYKRNPHLDAHPDSPFYGFGAPNNAFDRGVERGREQAAIAIRAERAGKEPPHDH